MALRKGRKVILTHLPDQPEGKVVQGEFSTVEENWPLPDGTLALVDVNGQTLLVDVEHLEPVAKS